MSWDLTPFLSLNKSVSKDGQLYKSFVKTKNLENESSGDQINEKKMACSAHPARQGRRKHVGWLYFAAQHTSSKQIIQQIFC